MDKIQQLKKFAYENGIDLNTVRISEDLVVAVTGRHIDLGNGCYVTANAGGPTENDALSNLADALSGVVIVPLGGEGRIEVPNFLGEKG